MKVNIVVLQEAIVKKCTTKNAFAVKLGIDESTLYRKLNAEGKSFTMDEVHKMVDILELSESEANEIFLHTDSHK